MRGRQVHVPSVGPVPYVPGARPGGRIYQATIPHPQPAAGRWDRRGVLAVLAVLAGSLVADGAALWLAAWLFL